MTRLRTWYGIDLDFLSNNYQYDLLLEHGDFISQLTNGNMATLDRNVLTLNASGLAKADEITLKFFREED